jgi:hypothetical protein
LLVEKFRMIKLPEYSWFDEIWQKILPNGTVSVQCVLHSDCGEKLISVTGTKYFVL